MYVYMKVLVLILLLESAWDKDDRTLDGQNFFFLIFIYSAAPGLCCGTGDLRSSSLILVAACKI